MVVGDRVTNLCLERAARLVSKLKHELNLCFKKNMISISIQFLFHVSEFLAWSNILWQRVPQSNCKLYENVLSLIRI